MIPRPGGNHGVDDLKEETGPILNRSAILVSSLIAAILQKLVDEVAVTRVNLNAIKSGRSCVFDSSRVKFENARNFRFFNGPMRRRLYPAVRRRYETGWILPIFRVH